MIKKGNIYLDCGYHPVICTKASYDEVEGKSLVDGVLKSCSVKHCAPVKITKREAKRWLNAWKRGGLRGAMRLRGWKEEQINEFILNWRTE